MTRSVKVYRSKRQVGMYLFVDAGEELSRVPEDLLKHFGAPVPALDLELSPDRKLAQSSAATVLASIEDSGFYLQLPPEVDPVTGRKRGP